VERGIHVYRGKAEPFIYTFYVTEKELPERAVLSL
jgi:hypothetical protein